MAAAHVHYLQIKLKMFDVVNMRDISIEQI
jgi:hypothetical protein